MKLSREQIVLKYYKLFEYLISNDMGNQSKAVIHVPRTNLLRFILNNCFNEDDEMIRRRDIETIIGELLENELIEEFDYYESVFARNKVNYFARNRVNYKVTKLTHEIFDPMVKL